MKHITANAGDFVPASHEDPQNPGVLKRVIATASELQQGQVQMLNWANLPVGHNFSPHYHEDMQEIFVLLKGTVSMEAGDKTVTMNVGDTVIVQPLEVHKMTNLGQHPAEYLVFGISSGENGKTIVVDG